ncbi:MAG: hypothetical protein ABTD50_21995, partial [Polyangiaceae bacterium]
GRRPLLGGVPWIGSPASSLLLRRSDFSMPIPPRFALASLGGTAAVQQPKVFDPAGVGAPRSRAGCPAL